MVDYLFKVTKFIPKLVVETVYDINFNKLYAEGKRYILLDVDNTLIPYDIFYADDKLKALLKQIQEIGFKLIIISNNKSERIGNFARDVNIDYITSAKKPLKLGYKKALKRLGNPNRNEVLSIGDQLVTDVLGSNRMNFDCILVRPLKKSTEKWYTKFNRKIEKHALKRIKKYNEQIYKEIEEKHEY